MSNDTQRLDDEPKVAGWVKLTPGSFRLAPVVVVVCQRAAAKRAVTLEQWLAEAIWNALVAERDPDDAECTVKLRPKERSLLRLICDAFPKDIDIRELAAKAKRSPEGAFSRTLTDLVRRNLINRHNGRVKATEAGRVAAA